VSPGHRPFVIDLAKVDLLEPAERFREEFARRRSLFCRHVFAPAFLDRLSAILARATFGRDGVENLLFRTTEQPARASGAISLALRRSNLMRWVEQVTACEVLVTASGRVTQTVADPTATLDWHSDMREPARRIGITINLGEAPYEGGVFELRRRNGEILTEHRHVERGSALIFDVGPDYQHRVRAVMAGGPRRVYAGWFYKSAS
jgi:hypothetical protein